MSKRKPLVIESTIHKRIRIEAKRRGMHIGKLADILLDNAVDSEKNFIPKFASLANSEVKNEG